MDPTILINILPQLCITKNHPRGSRSTIFKKEVYTFGEEVYTSYTLKIITNIFEWELFEYLTISSRVSSVLNMLYYKWDKLYCSFTLRFVFRYLSFCYGHMHVLYFAAWVYMSSKGFWCVCVCVQMCNMCRCSCTGSMIYVLHWTLSTTEFRNNHPCRPSYSEWHHYDTMNDDYRWLLHGWVCSYVCLLVWKCPKSFIESVVVRVSPPSVTIVFPSWYTLNRKSRELRSDGKQQFLEFLL